MALTKQDLRNRYVVTSLSQRPPKNPAFQKRQATILLTCLTSIDLSKHRKKILFANSFYNIEISVEVACYCYLRESEKLLLTDQVRIELLRKE